MLTHDQSTFRVAETIKTVTALQNKKRNAVAPGQESKISGNKQKMVYVKKNGCRGNTETHEQTITTNDYYNNTVPGASASEDAFVVCPTIKYAIRKNTNLHRASP